MSEQSPGNQPPYGQQPPSYGDQPPAHGQQPPPSGEQPPAYGQQPPAYGPPPAYGQQPPSYGQPPSGGQPPAYGTAGPAAEMSPSDQRLWGMLAHLSAIVSALVLSALSAGIIYLGAVGPLVIFLVLKDRGIFVRRQALEALNFQILLTVVYLAGVLLSVVTLGLGLIVVVPLAIVVGVVALVFTIIAAVKANQGIDYRYPINWRLVK